MKDRTLFHEKPYLSAENGRYKLKWTYGDMGCIFFPESKIANGELHFYLTVTTSSGCIPDRPGSMEINDPGQVRAIESHGAYWLEPDGSKINIDIRR